MPIRVPIPVSLPPTASAPAPALHAPRDAYRDGSPIVLSASVTLQPNDAKAPNTVALVNPTPHAVEINEISFHLQSDSPGLSPGVVGVKMVYRGCGKEIPVSNNYVPLWLGARSRQLNLGETVSGSDTSTGGSSVEAFYAWTFRHPIHLEPGETVDVSLSHLGLIDAAIVADICYRGRVMVGHPVPREVWVPFVAAFIGEAVNMGYYQAQFTDPDYTEEQSSTEIDLANTSDHPVEVDLLTGRLMTENSGTGTGYAYSDEVQAFIDSLFTVSLVCSAGYEVTKEAVPFRLLFGRDDRAFPAAFELAPGEYLLATITATMGSVALGAGTTQADAPVPNGPVVPQIGLVGYARVQR